MRRAGVIAANLIGFSHPAQQMYLSYLRYGAALWSLSRISSVFATVIRVDRVVIRVDLNSDSLSSAKSGATGCRELRQPA